MTSNLGTHAARDLARELTRAYDGKVPAPYYWQIPSTPPRAHGRRHPGEMLTAFPYSLLPAQVIRGSDVSLEELEDLVERRARREELGG
jgi:hypothetical protein